MYLLGIDVGTTNTKALLTDYNGKVISKAQKGYDIITSSGGKAEQNPEDWWDACVYCICKVCESVSDKSQITALSLSTQGASSVLLDAGRKPCGNAITWLDSRSTAEKLSLEKLNNDDWIYKTTGYRLSESLDAAKLLWYKNNQSKIFENASIFVSTIEYINFKLTGEFVTDPANAAIRQLENIKDSRWSEELLNYIGFPLFKMPKIAPAGTLIGNLTAEATKQTGLDRRTRVYLGAHDQYCAAIGAGAVKSGDMILSTGTAWVMLGITDYPTLTPSYISSARHIVNGLWGALASIPAAGASLEWFRKICPNNYSDIDCNAAKRMESAKDLFFFPYLAGAGFPLWNSKIRAAFSGLCFEHDSFDMFRTVLEGVAFQVRLGIEEFKRSGISVSRLAVIGGAAKSHLWLEIIAAVTGIEIFIGKEKDAACLGAAMIAAVGEGLFKSYAAAAENFINEGMPLKAKPEMVEFYKQKLEKYMDLISPCLKTLI